MVREGAGALLSQGAEAWGRPKTKPFLPNVLTDAQPVHEQIEHAVVEVPEFNFKHWPRPGEPLTDRDREAFEGYEQLRRRMDRWYRTDPGAPTPTEGG